MALFLETATPGKGSIHDPTLSIVPGTQLIDQFKAYYPGMAHSFTLPRAVGGFDPCYEYEKGIDRYRRPPIKLPLDQIQLVLNELYWRKKRAEQPQLRPCE